MNFRALVLFALASSGCLDLSLPPQPGVGAPGVVTGRAVWQRPGRLTPEGASGASIYLLGSSVATAANADGRFVLDGVTSAEGTLLIRFDADRDGVPERQRTFVLADLGAARGRTVSMGDVSLSQPSLVAGRVRRGDQLAADAHGGTAVFVPGLPLAALTAANAEFQLEGVVEGPVQVAAVRAGYEASLSSPLLVRGGEEVRLSPTTLVPTSASMAGALRGRAVGLDGAGLSGVLVDVGSATTTTDGEGAWRISGLSVGRYDVVFSRADKRSAALFSVLVAGPDEILLPNVVLAPGGGPGPSLVEEVLGEHDAGVDAGLDAGADAGVDAGVDAGLDAGQMVAIDATPATMQVGQQHQLSATTTATPDLWTWRAAPAGLVRFDDPSSAKPTITALDAGTVTITVEALFTPDTVTDSVSIDLLAAPAPSVTTDAPGAKLFLNVGQQATVQAFVSPTPVTATWAWAIPAAGVARIVGRDDQPSVTIEGIADGLVGLALTVIADGTPVLLTPEVQLEVRSVDAGVDAGTGAAPLTITDAGITPLGLWLETADDVMSVSGELININGGTFAGAVRNNLARRRLSVVFDNPPSPGSQVSFSASSVVLTDGGVRRQPAMLFDVPGFQFRAPVALAGGTGVDFHPGVAFSPSGAVTTGRLNSTTSCPSTCFFANAPGVGDYVDEVTLQAVAPWRAAVNAGAVVQAWASTTQSYTLTPNGVWSTSATLPPGPTFADGTELRALGPFTGTAVQLFRDDATSWAFVEGAGAVASGTLSWAEAAALTTAPNTTRKLVLAVGSPGGNVRVFEKIATSWNEPLGLNTVSGATTGHLAMTPAGDVLAINSASNSPSFYGRAPGGNWAPLLFAIAGGVTVVELTAVGSHVYALLLETTGTPHLLTLTPAGNQQPIALPSLPCPVSSAALATSDFGDLSIAVSLNCSSVYSLQRIDLGTH